MFNLAPPLLTIFACQIGAPPNQQGGEFRNMLTARLARLQDISIRYHQAEETLISLEVPDVSKAGDLSIPPGVQINVDDAPREKECTFSFLDGRVRRDVRIAEDFLDDVTANRIHEHAVRFAVYVSERTEVLIQPAPGRNYFGNILDPQPVSSNIHVDFAIGIRVANVDPGWLDAKTIERMDIRAADDRRVEASLTDHLGTIHRWLFDADKGYGLVRYSLEGKDAGFVGMVIENGEFRNVDGLLLPFQIERAQYRKVDGEVKKWHSATIAVESYSLGSPENSLRRYSIQWPAGIPVYDARTGMAYRANDNGELVPEDAWQRGRTEGDQDRRREVPLAQELPAVEGSLWRGPLALLVALVAAGAAIGVHRRQARRDRRAWGLLTLLVILGLCNLPAMQATGQQIRWRDGVGARVVERLEHDLALDAEQAHECELLIETHRKSEEAANENYFKRMAEWERQYWKDRLPELDENFDGSDLPLERKMEIFAWRMKFKTNGAPIDGDPDFERAKRTVRGRAFLTLRSQKQMARIDLLEAIASILEEKQFAGWERAKRRFMIALHDGLTPRPDHCPVWNIDILALLDEACAEGAELARFAPVLGAPCAPDPGWSAIAGAGELSEAIERFEFAYLRALRGHEDGYTEFYRARLAADPGDQESMQEIVDDLRYKREPVWRARVRFVNELKTIAEELLGEAAATAWEDRFAARCCSSLFRPDRVDAALQRIRAIDELPEDMREDVEAVVARYESERRRIRHFLVRREIDATYARRSRLERVQADIAELRERRHDVEDRTLRTLSILLQERADVIADLRNPPVPDHWESARRRD